MLEDPTTLAAVAASTGFIIGYGLKTVIVNRKAPRKGRSFTAKQLERWHCKKKWADILLRKDKMQYAESEMVLLNQEKAREDKKLTPELIAELISTTAASRYKEKVKFKVFYSL